MYLPAIKNFICTNTTAYEAFLLRPDFAIRLKNLISVFISLQRETEQVKVNQCTKRCRKYKQRNRRKKHFIKAEDTFGASIPIDRTAAAAI